MVSCISRQSTTILDALPIWKYILYELQPRLTGWKLGKWHFMQGGSDGSGRQSCKCNYVDITKMPGPHADTARVMPGAHAHIAHTVCVKPGSHADTVCVKPGPHADINLKSKQSKIYNIFFSIKTITMRNEPQQPTFPTQPNIGNSWSSKRWKLFALANSEWWSPWKI